MKQENEKKTFSMRMLLNMVGLFVFTGMIVSAYTQAFYLDEHLEIYRFVYMTAREWKEFFLFVSGTAIIYFVLANVLSFKKKR
ncbi:hypothetical protein QNH18_02155 [Bacillus paralicheniformis]|uniref:hypothetical protein n=1 Tax=Bacillus TaxID=1386 RepID=UPI00132BD891|nr:MULTISPECIES: hypothetical protein [Bacillus]MCQ5456962.1 hypothetical protein [Bacillus paralicheniformis]MDE1384426.1 hypothetical protein [Bacillus paralicheniformis]MED1221931.1 hypothetical protein [Bacillus paralicheniformis]TWK51737.1 hypothetical protein CHCC20347_3037 [Bacillus paralicheniformis]WHX87162.1 hypothetical protein QNH18_02155 [Bacillus paralicheniformis]